MLGGLFAICSAATFAFNNASVRRGVLTGSVAQAMAITVPIGVPLFFLAALITGTLGEITGFSRQGLAALALAGAMHFVWGRYCNYRATKALGTNLVAPIQQVNLIITLLLAIWLLGQCSVFVRNREQLAEPPVGLVLDETMIEWLCATISHWIAAGLRPAATH